MFDFFADQNLRILAIHGAKNIPRDTFFLIILQPDRLLKFERSFFEQMVIDAKMCKHLILMADFFIKDSSYR